MRITRTIAEMCEITVRARHAGQRIGFVPTMGALHEGHFSHINAARLAGDFVVVSIFVNPTQFGPNEDFQQYPRPEADDLAACRQHQADAVFLPPVEEMYDDARLTEVSVRDLPETLCGACRPGHFTGVCTVVAKLFNIVQPDRAYFGQKDFQQAVILQRMTRDLNFPIEIIVGPTIREPDGLARSSRNVYLSEAERRQAPALHAALRTAAERIAREAPPAADILAEIRAHLGQHAPSGEIEYCSVVDPDTLRPLEQTVPPVAIALAVKFRGARLIDNILLDSTGKIS